LDTQRALAQKGIAPTGLGELVILKREGTRFGFLGFDLTVRNLNEKDLILIRESKAKVDVLIVGVHWGVEYTNAPTDTQRSWAKQIVLQGADVIAGHHPHWVQTSEIIDGKPVFYSLGNLVFDQMWSEKTRHGMIAKLKFVEGRLNSKEERKIYIQSWAQPEFSP
jgi:poly-gamma-glutamate capsule biosynthesis protein CapA/YwtB (metallophosphatase superfamily)